MYNVKIRHREGQFASARYEDKVFSAAEPEDLDRALLAYWPDSDESNTRILSQWES